jgi:Cu/Ag efflux protein CusF
MKRIAQLAVIAAFSASAVAFAQNTGDMMDMDHKKCMEMKNMGGMEKQKCKGMMKGMTSDDKAKSSTNTTAHTASAVVKAVDPANGKVTLAHGPVKSLQWPAMTMAFAVKDKALFDKLTVGKKVDVEFTQQGTAYTVSAVK